MGIALSCLVGIIYGLMAVSIGLKEWGAGDKVKGWMIILISPYTLYYVVTEYDGNRKIMFPVMLLLWVLIIALRSSG